MRRPHGLHHHLDAGRREGPPDQAAVRAIIIASLYIKNPYRYCCSSSSPLSCRQGRAGVDGRQEGGDRARSHCRLVLSPIHVIPDFLRYSVPLLLKRQCDRTLGGEGAGRAAAQVPQHPARTRRRGQRRARSHCRFVLTLIHFIPDSLT
jgi:hypothetical protein